jgi:hypothetical protein
LRLAGHPAWHGSRPLGEDWWRDFVVLQLRPGTMVTASTLRHGHHAPHYDILARIAAVVEVPG